MRRKTWSAAKLAVVTGSLLAIIVVVASVRAAEQTSPNAAGPAADQQRIRRLIEALGAEQFATREKAQSELERMGVEVFDALNEARENPDIEIAHRVRHLLLGMRVVWSPETDPEDVRRIMQGYGERNDLERQGLADRLTTLDPSKAAAPLCRIARFDHSDRLAKYAALKLMSLSLPKDASAQQKQKLAGEITSLVSGSRRVASEWLRTYAQSIIDPASTLPAWQRLTRDELDRLDQFDELDGRENARDLLRWYAHLLHQLDRPEESLAAVRQTLDLMDGTREQLLDTVDWLIEHETYVLVSELATRYPNQFGEFAMLQYRLAEAQMKQGDAEAAKQTVAKARAMKAEEPTEHIAMAVSLQERGLFEWAEGEYRLVIDNFPAASYYVLQSRFLMASMLHDLQRDNEAADMLEVALQTMDVDRNLQQMMELRTGMRVVNARAQMNYYGAEHLARQTEWEKVRENLTKAIEANPDDVDVVIAMYRVPNATDEWKADAMRRIQSAVNGFRAQIATIEPI
ncbi:MAG: hypothetical protein KDA62_19460, partial [Planctomycetales bacterium]|nr:hypothetical protein [Planctomycetales bacterium]